MATIKEVEKQLREAKKKNREKDKIIEEHLTHIKFLTDRLEKAHERVAEKNKKIMTMTIEDVVKNQKELAEFQEKSAKDRELLHTFDKQVEVQLDTAGVPK